MSWSLGKPDNSHERRLLPDADTTTVVQINSEPASPPLRMSDIESLASYRSPDLIPPHKLGTLPLTSYFQFYLSLASFLGLDGLAVLARVSKNANELVERLFSELERRPFNPSMREGISREDMACTHAVFKALLPAMQGNHHVNVRRSCGAPIKINPLVFANTNLTASPNHSDVFGLTVLSSTAIFPMAEELEGLLPYPNKKTMAAALGANLLLMVGLWIFALLSKNELQIGTTCCADSYSDECDDISCETASCTDILRNNASDFVNVYIGSALAVIQELCRIKKDSCASYRYDRDDVFAPGTDESLVLVCHATFEVGIAYTLALLSTISLMRLMFPATRALLPLSFGVDEEDSFDTKQLKGAIGLIKKAGLWKEKQEAKAASQMLESNSLIP